MPSEYLEHHGIKGQKWYVRRFQNEDGTLTPLGRRRLGYGAERKKEREKNKKEKMLNSPQKLAKKTAAFTMTQLKTAVEKAELANKLRETEVKKTDIANKLKAKKKEGKKSISKVLGKLIKNRAEYKHEKKMREEDLRKKRALADIEIANAKAALGKPSAEKWKNRAEKIGSIVKVAKSMKELTDDLGITKESSGKTIFGAIATAMGLKKASSDKDKKDDAEKKAEKKAEKAAEKVKDTAKEINDNVKNNITVSLNDAKTNDKSIFSFDDKDNSSVSYSDLKEIPFERAKKGPRFLRIPTTNRGFDNVTDTSKIEATTEKERKYLNPPITKKLIEAYDPNLNVIKSNSNEGKRARKILKTPTITNAVEEAKKSTTYSDDAVEKWFKFDASNTKSSIMSKIDEVPFITINKGGIPSPIPLFAGGVTGHINISNSYSPKEQSDIRNKLDKIDPKKWQIKHEDAIEEGKNMTEFNETAFRVAEEFICHHGIKGQKWGTRRYQNQDGSLTQLGKSRLGIKESKKALKSLIKENKRTYASEKKNVKNIYKQLKKSKNEKDKFKAKEMKADRKAMYKNVKKNSSKLAAWMAYSTGGVGGLLARNHGLKKAAQRQWVLKNSKKANAAQKAVEKAREKLYKQQLKYKQQKKKK